MINMDRVYGYLAAFSVGVVFMIVANMSDKDVRGERDLYCEMVMLYDATDGEYGWPDYKNEIEFCEE